jgi:hypothetical protein
MALSSWSLASNLRALSFAFSMFSVDLDGLCVMLGAAWKLPTASNYEI